jgi:hypothetical protein
MLRQNDFEGAIATLKSASEADPWRLASRALAKSVSGEGMLEMATIEGCGRSIGPDEASGRASGSRVCHRSGMTRRPTVRGGTENRAKDLLL